MSVCLVTHHKAGTHWSKYFLANYVALVINGGNAARVDFDEMEELYFPIRIDAYFSGAKMVPKHPLATLLRSHIGVDALYWAHFDPKQKDRFSDFDKVIFQCRNPMDFLVSKFHYDFKRINDRARNSNLPAMSSPSDLHPKATAAWCQIFSTMVDLSKANAARSAIVSYEQLKANPEIFFGRIVKHLFGEINPEYLKEAISNSTIDKSREDEVKRSKPIVGHTYSMKDHALVAGSFARSGAVGQFNQYFDSMQQLVIEEFVLNNLDEGAQVVFDDIFSTATAI